jgi:hypothetical protein
MPQSSTWSLSFGLSHQNLVYISSPTCVTYPTNLILLVLISSSSVPFTPQWKEHRARAKVHHLVLFAAKSFTSVQLFFSGFNSFSTVCHHVVLRCPLFLVPCGFHSSVSFVISLGGFISVCPIYFHFLFFRFLLI